MAATDTVWKALSTGAIEGDERKFRPISLLGNPYMYYITAARSHMKVTCIIAVNTLCFPCVQHRLDHDKIVDGIVERVNVSCQSVPSHRDACNSKFDCNQCCVQ